MTHHTLSAAIVVTLLLAAPTMARAEGQHAIVSPEEIKWAPGPPSLPPGAELAVLFGDPTKEGLFAMRLKLPKGYQIAPHSHPKPEVLTVISGVFRLGMGEIADRAAANPLASGGFFAMPPGSVHHAFTDEDTVVQLNSFGPWSITYVRPEDDPRNKTQ